MEERSLPHLSLRLTLLSVAAAVGVAMLAAREGPRCLRLAGLSVYLAAVSRSWPDIDLLRAAYRAGGTADVVVPYWGCRSTVAPVAPQRSRRLVGGPIS